MSKAMRSIKPLSSGRTEKKRLQKFQGKPPVTSKAKKDS